MNDTLVNIYEVFAGSLSLSSLSNSITGNVAAFLDCVAPAQVASNIPIIGNLISSFIYNIAQICANIPFLKWIVPFLVGEGNVGKKNKHFILSL